MPSEAQTAFFSYSREDSEFALKLAEDMKAAGASVWIDQLDIEPGVEWDSAVEGALNSSASMLVILSPVSVSSKNVRDEVSFALNEGKRVIPVLYRDCKVPFRLARLQQIDFRTDYARALKTLLRTFGVEQPPPSLAAAAPAAIAEQLVAVVDAQRAAEQARTEEEERKSADSAVRLTAIVDAERAAAQARTEAEGRERQAADEKARQQKLEEERREAATEQVRPFGEESIGARATPRTMAPPPAAKMKPPVPVKTSRGPKKKPTVIVVALAAAVLVVGAVAGYVMLRSREAAEQVAKSHGVYLDPETKLMWTKKDNGQDVTWDKANQYCKNLNWAGLPGWEVPTYGELRTLYDPRKDSSTREIRPTGYWVSSERAHGSHYSSDPLVVFSGMRDKDSLDNSVSNRALCVRRSQK